MLRKEPPSKEVVDGDVFQVDVAALAKQKLTRLRLSAPQPPREQREAASLKMHAEVARDRGYAIDAAVVRGGGERVPSPRGDRLGTPGCLTALHCLQVRTMKARKTMTHGALVAEVLGQLRFPGSGGDVKKRLESLLEREYIERDDDKPGTYKYLA